MTREEPEVEPEPPTLHEECDMSPEDEALADASSQRVAAQWAAEEAAVQRLRLKRLSHLIRTGSAGRKQVFTTLIEPNVHGAIDVLGAAHLGWYGLDIEPTWQGVYQLFAELNIPVGEYRYACPKTPCPIQEADPDGRYDMMATIIHLNDNHHWSFKEIAFWVERQGY